MKHGWHFDQSQFSTTLMIQKPEEGGLFQFTKPIRGVLGDKRESKIQVKNYIGLIIMVKLDYNKQLWDLPNLFVLSRIHYNPVG
jgi:hypothetical protein